MEALAIPLASIILGGAGLLITVVGRMNENDRNELRDLRRENDNLRTSNRELREENAYLLRKAAGLT